MKILVRLPNWLGDMVMSVGFIHQLQDFFPDAEISVIAKKGIHELLPFFPAVKHNFIFSKDEFNGLGGQWRFGKEISKIGKFDLFFCMPDSFSSALIGFAVGTRHRVGYKKEVRNLLLTHAYTKPRGLHRVEEYCRLLEFYAGRPVSAPRVLLHHSFPKENYIIVNINSEASSRRLTVPKAVELLNALRSATDQKILLIGAPKERPFVEGVLQQMANRDNVENVAGKTTLSELVRLLSSAQLMLSTDSGPAHLANALQTHTIVLFGAGNEQNTAPYNKAFRTIIRLGELSCEPCQKNVCMRFETPQCLERLNTAIIVRTALDQIKYGERRFR